MEVEGEERVSRWEKGSSGDKTIAIGINSQARLYSQKSGVRGENDREERMFLRPGPTKKNYC